MSDGLDARSAPGLPKAEGEPVFDAPWQARAFAMCISLHQQGMFSWQEWADKLSGNIAKFEQQASVDSSEDYYTLWQQTLEEFVCERT